VVEEVVCVSLSSKTSLVRKKKKTGNAMPMLGIKGGGGGRHGRGKRRRGEAGEAGQEGHKKQVQQEGGELAAWLHGARARRWREQCVSLSRRGEE
jgi:hypothetical protein